MSWTSPPLACFTAMAPAIPVAAPAPCSVVVMRSDDNGNEVEVTRVTSRCEADAIVRDYEARGHKQLYWIADA